MALHINELVSEVAMTDRAADSAVAGRTSTDRESDAIALLGRREEIASRTGASGLED